MARVNRAWDTSMDIDRRQPGISLRQLLPRVQDEIACVNWPHGLVTVRRQGTCDCSYARRRMLPCVG